MVAREVPFTGNYSLLYSWANLNQFFAAYSIKNLDDFNMFWKTRMESLEFGTDYPQIIMFGLNRKESKSSIEEAEALFYQYMEDHTLQDIQELIVNAQMSALINTDTPGEVKGETVKPPRHSKS